MLKQRSITQEMNRLRFVDLHSYKFGTSEVPTLDHFKEFQEVKRKQI